MNFNFQYFFLVVPDPSRLQDEMTRYHLYLQVRQDLLDCRLRAPPSTLCLLASYAAQGSAGDHDRDLPVSSIYAPFREAAQRGGGANKAGKEPSEPPLPDAEFDRRVSELHKLHRGQSPAEAEYNFLEHAKRLETYGISLHPGRDSGGKEIQLGVTSAGLVVFQGQARINTFSWSKIVKISFKRKQFFIQLRRELTESYDTLLGFNLASYRSCKNLWKSAVEHHSFFRLHSPKPPARRFLMTLGSRFRYSGRTEYQNMGLGQQQQQQQQQPGARQHHTIDARPKAFPNRSAAARKTLPLALENNAAAAAASGKSNGRVPR